MPGTDTILFDWDGTLAQTLEIWLKTFKEAYAAVGVYPSDKDIGSHFGNWQAHLELGVKPKDEEKYQKHLEIAYERLSSVPLYDGAKEVLEKLRTSGYKTGLVSTSHRKMLDVALATNNLSDFFDVIVAAEDTVNHKPDPEPLYVALGKLKASIDTTVFIGDSDKDTGAAMNAKMRLFLFMPKTHSLYYNLSELQSAPAVEEVFSKWQDFPFGKLG